MFALCLLIELTRVTYIDPKVTYFDPRVTHSHPKMTYSDPKVTCSDPKVTRPVSDPFAEELFSM